MTVSFAFQYEASRSYHRSWGHAAASVVHWLTSRALVRKRDRGSQSSRSYSTGQPTNAKWFFEDQTVDAFSHNSYPKKLLGWDMFLRVFGWTGAFPWRALDDGPTSLFCLTRNALTSLLGPTGVPKLCIFKMTSSPGISYCIVQSFT